MSTKKSNEIVRIDEIVNRINSKFGISRKNIAEQIFEMSSNALGMKVNRGTFKSTDIEKVAIWASNENVSLHWLLTGEGAPYLADLPNHTGNVVGIDFNDILKSFKNRALTKEIIEILKGIEDADSDHLREVKGLLRAELARIKDSHNPKKPKLGGN